MFTAIIIEDERNSREFLSKLLGRHFSEKVIVLGVAESLSEGVKLINKFKSKIDIVFLDIQMPHEDGFQLFKYIKEITFEVIFTTAHKDYSIEAIRLSAFDYLLKPINYIDVKSSLNRLEKKHDSKSNELRIKGLIENLNPNDSSFNKIAFPTLEGFRLEKISNILYCKAQGNYTEVITIFDEKILLSKTLGNIESLLPKTIFCRVHKSFLININYVKNYSKANSIIFLTTNEEIPVSIRKSSTFINAIQNN